MKRFMSGAASLLLVLASAGTALAGGGSSADRAKLYYLSLGDSLAAGVQPIGDPSDGFRTSDGYAEQLLDLARTQDPKLALQKLGCPGESTATMIHGGLCAYPHGSQLDEAIAFLKGHRPFVAFVTIDLGANDFPCYEAHCVPAGVTSIQTNLPAILAALRDAAGPDIPIIGMDLYNPLLAAWLLGPDGQQLAQVSQTQLVAPVNGLLRSIYGAAGDPTADVEGAFASNDFATIVDLPGAGPVPLNVARICTWTWVCAPAPFGPDNHANAEGYGVIAAAYAEAIGL